MNDRTRMRLGEARELVENVLVRHGLGAAHIRAVADIIMAGERDDCASHGIYRLLLCVDTIEAGKVSLDAEPRVQDIAPALVRVDASGGFAPLAYRKARPLLVEKAKRCGIAALGINRCFHFAALWPDVEALAREGLAAFACRRCAATRRASAAKAKACASSARCSTKSTGYFEARENIAMSIATVEGIKACRAGRGHPHPVACARLRLPPAESPAGDRWGEGLS
jgi:hypothetical protein